MFKVVQIFHTLALFFENSVRLNEAERLLWQELVGKNGRFLGCRLKHTTGEPVADRNWLPYKIEDSVGSSFLLAVPVYGSIPSQIQPLPGLVRAQIYDISPFEVYELVLQNLLPRPKEDETLSAS